MLTQVEKSKRSEYLTISEFSLKANCHVSSLRRWLKNNPEFSSKYCSFEKSRGGSSGKRILIHISGILPYCNSKASTGKSLGVVTALNREAKIKTAEIVIKAITPSEDPMILQLQHMLMVRQEQLNQSKRLDNIETKIEEVKQLTLETPPITMVTSQREFLNDRLRNYCAQTEVSHSFVWKKLHDYVGKGSINDYKFDDYKPAIRYLKEMYRSSHISW